MRLLCVGMNHTTAPLALRETAAVAPEDVAPLLRNLHQRWPGAEFLLLDTCNRTELYTLRPLHGHPREEELEETFLSRLGAPTAALTEALYLHTGMEAVRHLFSVAAGLDSLVPGETQIVAQSKQALAIARQAHAAAAGMSSLLDDALAAARCVRRETPIAQGKASIASVAYQAICETFPSLTGRCILAIGGGKMSELLLRLLAKESADLSIANRSVDRAEQLAAACGAKVVGFGELETALGRADVVVTCTASPEPILTADALARAMPSRNGRDILLIDLAIPRDVDPRAGRISGVTLRNLDDMSAVVDRTVARRSEHIEAAWSIVNEHVEQYLRKADIRRVVPTIDALYRRIEETLHEELTEASNKLSTHDDHEEDLDILRRTLHRALRRFCHPAVETLRNEAAHGAGGAHAETLRTLFQLDGHSDRDGGKGREMTEQGGTTWGRRKNGQ